MGYLRLSITEIHNALMSGEVTPYELVREALTKAHKCTCNAFEYIYDREAYFFVEQLKEKNKNNLLWGIPFAIKDNFSTKDIPSCASSNMLNGYIPPFNSEVYRRLISQGAIPIGKTTMDELAMGGKGISGHLGPTYNPWDTTHKHTIGGSSCGSAAVVSAGIVPFAIGSDTGDSVRKPASYSCLVGMKPTWGRVSRYGLFPFAPSLDHVAYFTRNVFDSTIVLQAIAGHDEKDATSSILEVPNYSTNLSRSIKGKRLAIIKDIFEEFPENDVKEVFINHINTLKSMGAIIEEVSIGKDIVKALLPVYRVISSAEATSSYASLDGIKYGPTVSGDSIQEIMTKNRTLGMSESIKHRFIFGRYSLLKENRNDVFNRATKARRLIVNAFNEVLKSYDGIYLPASPTSAPLMHEDNEVTALRNGVAENFLSFANFAGLPSITIPLGFSYGLPFGANLTCGLFKERDLFDIANSIEDITGMKDLSARGGNA